MDCARHADIRAFFYRDTANWSDLYTYFEDSTGKAVENKERTFTVKGANSAIPKGATVKVYDASGSAIDAMQTSVSEEGTFAMTFAEAGSYVVEVSGKATYTASVWDSATGGYVTKEIVDAPITPARLDVTVYPYVTKTIYMTFSDKTGSFAIGKTGAEIYRMPLTVEDNLDDPDGAVTLQEVGAALHEQQYPDGLSGYQASSGWVSKFWGDGSGSFGYFLNDVYMNGSGT